MKPFLKKLRNKVVIIFYEYLVNIRAFFELIKNKDTSLHKPDCDIYVPVPGRYFWVSIAGISSFLFFYNTKIHIINDGSLKKWQIYLFKMFFPQIELLKHNFHLSSIKKFPELIEWSNKTWAAGKFLSPIIHSKKSKYLIFDCDILFLKKPKELIDWIENETKFSRFSFDCRNYSVLSKLEMDRLLKKKHNFSNVNSGMVAIQKHLLTKKNLLSKINQIFLAMIDQMDDRLLTDTNDFPRSKIAVLDFCFGKSVIEQSLHAWFFNILPTKKLPSSYTLAPFFRTNFHNELIPTKVKVIHFTGEKDKRLMYKYLAHSIIYKIKSSDKIPWFNAMPLNNLNDQVYPLLQKII